MTNAELNELLAGDHLQALPTLTNLQREQLAELVREPAFAILLGIMIAVREGYRTQLENWPAHDTRAVQTLGVLQGKSQALDILRENIIQCISVPAHASEDKA